MASWRRSPVLSLIHRRARTVAHRAFSELVYESGQYTSLACAIFELVLLPEAHF